MRIRSILRVSLLPVLASLSVAGSVLAADSIRVVPGRAVLLGPDAVQQLVVDGCSTAGSVVDRTRSSVFTAADSSVADVDSTGLVIARGEGSTVVSVHANGMESKVPIEVRGVRHPPAMNFANQVVPIFTKLGCNSGGCHGKAIGQNGFRLSLLGFEPTLDYETLVKEDRGRRLFPAIPARSLLLEKALAKTPHGGGRRMDEWSHEHRVILRWIEAGMPIGRDADPVVARISVYPVARRLLPGSGQQMVVTAHYDDGRSEDVTRWAQYQSNEPDMAGVAEGGLVQARDHSGQAAVMARYQGKVAVFRATVPHPRRSPSDIVFDSDNPIDRLVRKQWHELGLEPSPECSDPEFIRRASLDITGTLPTAEETRAFASDTSARKRKDLIDRLLERPEYSAYFAIKWGDVLRNKRDGKPEYAASTYRFHDWIRESLQQNVPYDAFVRQILTATGTPEASPPVAWYRKKKKTDEYVDDTAQVFLGMRLQCAKCHHHPFEAWGQDDYYGFAAFFGRVKRKVRVDARKDGLKEEVIVTGRDGSVSHPRTGKTMASRGLGEKAAMPTTDDPRESLVDWMVAPTNPYFAPALVNRYWSHFFGRGIVEPLDDFRLTNPPSNPELLDALADSFIKSGYDLKSLIRMLTTSRVYGLSSVPNESNSDDRQSFARHYPRRFGSEALLDAISQMTGAPTPFTGLPPGTRAIDLPDEGIASSFLDAFGRPKRDSACECERVSDASLGQSLMLLNSPDIHAKLTAHGGRAERLAKDPRPDAEKVVELFWDAFARPPDSGESAAALDHLATQHDVAEKRLAFEDILWSLLNAKEFQFND